MKNVFNIIRQENGFPKPDEYWEAVFRDEENYPEKSEYQGECDVGQIFDPVSEVELLGHAKNDIVGVKEKVLSLPYACWNMLSHAYELLDKVQEYLYKR